MRIKCSSTCRLLEIIGVGLLAYTTIMLIGFALGAGLGLLLRA